MSASSADVLDFRESDRMAATAALQREVTEFSALDEHVRAGGVENLRPEDVHELAGSICDAVERCEEAGLSRAEIVRILEPVRRVHARSPFVRRLQEWPRGYPGDFETVDYICKGINRAQPGTLEYLCEEFALNLPIAQQHRNKVKHQAARIAATIARKPDARILILACGSCPDIEAVLPDLGQFRGELVLNDSDAAALAFAASVVHDVRDRCRFVHGNALKTVRRVEQLGGHFDLVVAGGLFDYLPEKHIVYLIRNVHERLLQAGGEFFFTNIANANPYRRIIEYLGDWFLIERSNHELARLCIEAGVPPESVTLGREETGLSILVDVRLPARGATVVPFRPATFLSV